MARRLSRRAVTTYVAEQLAAGNAQSIAQLAAHLVLTGHVRESNLYIRDIEANLADAGHVVAEVTSAFDLSAETKQHIEQFIKNKTAASQVTLRESIDPAVLGGVRVRTPGRELDATVRRHLVALRTQFKKA